ncbi:hypothetical protein GCM10017711_35160 [Paeniglutamicibacter sulfureus]
MVSVPAVARVVAMPGAGMFRVDHACVVVFRMCRMRSIAKLAVFRVRRGCRAVLVFVHGANIYP